MRKIIAVMQTSLDGYIEGPNKEMDWISDDEESWRALDEPLHLADTFILGRVMYPGYEEYWTSILANPKGILPLTGKAPTENEIDFARHADTIPHLVLSRTLDKVDWKVSRIVRDIEDIRKIKSEPGKSMLVWGGATLVCSLMNHGLIDELRLMVTPIILGGGTLLFKDVNKRKTLKLASSKQLQSGKVSLIYEL